MFFFLFFFNDPHIIILSDELLPYGDDQLAWPAGQLTLPASIRPASESESPRQEVAVVNILQPPPRCHRGPWGWQTPGQLQPLVGEDGREAPPLGVIYCRCPSGQRRPGPARARRSGGPCLGWSRKQTLPPAKHAAALRCSGVGEGIEPAGQRGRAEKLHDYKKFKWKIKKNVHFLVGVLLLNL